jgi:hypothetical protein
MNTDPTAFFRTDFPALFNQGVAQLEQRAAGGDEKSKARHDDIKGARGAVRLVFEGAGELWLAVREGAMQALDARPADLPVRAVLGAPVEAARAGLEELASAAEGIDPERAARRVARSASAEVEQVLDGHRIEFHVVLTDLPTDPDEVTIRVGLGVEEPPTAPKFTATVSWDDIEDLRAGELKPQQLLGRLKIQGDASQAMALGMSLMQRRQGR